MFITLTITTPKDKNDIRIDDRQRISAAAGILEATDKSAYGPAGYYRSKMQKRMVSACNTFLQEDIQTGDELVMVTARKGEDI
jgi:hypothetical protein